MDKEKNTSTESQQSKSEKLKKIMLAKKKVIIAVMIPIALLLIVFAVGYGVFSHYYSKMNHHALEENYEIASDIEPDDEDAEGEDSSDEDIAALEEYLEGNLNSDADGLKFDDKNVKNILLIGTDNRSTDSKGSRSDSMIIISINRNTKKIVMTSVMRDIYLTIPGVGGNRINAAYAYGGVELLLDTIEANFKISIDEYASVDFYSFMDVVDTVGGVTLDVTADEIKVMQGYIYELNELENAAPETDMIYAADAGKVTLNGKQALAYSRVRYVGNADFERTERQRKVLTAIFNKAKGLSLSELNDLANVLLPRITTNLTQGDVLSLILHANEYLNYDVVSCRMPIDDSYSYMKIRGMSVLGIDFDKNRKYWYENVYGSTD